MYRIAVLWLCMRCVRKGNNAVWVLVHGGHVFVFSQQKNLTE